MDDLGLKRYCCRRMIMTHVDLIEKLLKFVTDPDDDYRGRGRGSITDAASRYTPDGRNEKKQRLNELA